MRRSSSRRRALAHFRHFQARDEQQAHNCDRGGGGEQHGVAHALRKEHAQKRTDCSTERGGQHVVAHALTFALRGNQRGDNRSDGGRARAVGEPVGKAQHEQGREADAQQVQQRADNFHCDAHHEDALATQSVHHAARDDACDERANDEDARREAGGRSRCVVDLHGVAGDNYHQAVVVHHQQEVDEGAQKEILRPEALLSSGRLLRAPVGDGAAGDALDLVHAD